MRGRIGLVLAVGVLISLLAGCGGGGGPTPPQAPKNLTGSRNWVGTADNLYQVVQLSWDPVSGATYNVYREPEGGAPTKINSQPINQTTYTDTITADDLLSKKITYYVTAVGPGGESGLSNKWDTLPPSINAPKNLKADRQWVGTANNLTQEVTLIWENWRTTKAVTYYKIYRNGELIADNVQGTTYTDKQIPTDLYSKTITYKVATCIQGYEEAGAEVPTSPPSISAPQNLTADRHWDGSGSNVSQETVLSWGHWRNRQVATSYKIYRNGTLIGTTTGTTYTDQVPQDLWSQTIIYKVATYIQGYEESAAEISTSQPQLLAPQNLSADRHWAGSSPNYYQETKLTWDVVTGATAYNVYMQAEGQSIVKIADKIKDTSFTHQIPSDLWTYNIDYFVSAVNETASLEGNKASVHTDANQVGPPPNPLSKHRKR